MQPIEQIDRLLNKSPIGRTSQSLAKSIKVLLISYCHFSDISELLATFISSVLFGEIFYWAVVTVFMFGPNKPLTMHNTVSILPLS